MTTPSGTATLRPSAGLTNQREVFYFVQGDPSSAQLPRDIKLRLAVNRKATLKSRPALLGRARVGVSFYVAPLLVYDPSEFAFHGLERVMNRFVQGLMRSVIHLLLFRDQFVARGHC